MRRILVLLQLSSLATRATTYGGNSGRFRHSLSVESAPLCSFSPRPAHVDPAAILADIAPRLTANVRDAPRRLLRSVPPAGGRRCGRRWGRWVLRLRVVARGVLARDRGVAGGGGAQVLNARTFGRTRSVKWQFSSRPGSLEAVTDASTAAWARPFVDAIKNPDADTFVLNGLSVS